jgi:hypothetical protein
METRVAFIQSILSDLNAGLKNNNKEKIACSIKNIRAICDDIDSELLQQNDEDYSENTYTDDGEFEVINEITFLYKPVTVNNIYDGEYLERFSEQRTIQLQGADAIKAHNEFWQQHITIRGNVYGSVPSELLSEGSSRKLIEYGWKPISVKVFDINKNIENERSFYDYCDEYYKNHILIKEKETDGFLVLKYEL